MSLDHPKRRDRSGRLARDDVNADDFLVGADSDVDPLVSVVMPTLNEQGGIVRCIDAVKRAVEEMGVPTEIIVSDSSWDRTPELAQKQGAIVVEPDEPGYGYAYRYAFEQVRGEYVVMGDADSTYDFEDVPRLLELVVDGDADIVIGNRLEGKIEDGAMPALHRYVGNPLLTRFLNTFYDAGVSDAHSGFRILTREALDGLDLESDGMEFASEMIMEAAVKDFQITEVPITYHERAGDATLNSFRDGWRHVKFMLINAPSYLFTVPAVGFVGAGALIMLTSLFGVEVAGVTFGTHTIIAGSLLTIVGFQVAGLATFSAIAADPILTPSDGLVTWTIENFRLEHGVTLGLALTALGGAYVWAMVIRWVASDFSALPFVDWNMVAFTLIVVGVQLLFNSFFLSLLGQESAGPGE